MRGREVKSKWEFAKLGWLSTPLNQRRSGLVPVSLRGDLLLTTWKSLPNLCPMNSRTVAGQKSPAAPGSSKSIVPGMPETPNQEVRGRGTFSSVSLILWGLLLGVATPYPTLSQCQGLINFFVLESLFPKVSYLLDCSQSS